MKPASPDAKRARKSASQRQAELRARLIRTGALVLVALMVLSVLVSALYPAWASPAPQEPLDEYHLLMTMLEDQHAFHVTQTVDYQNRTGEALESVMFNLYDNIYRRSASAPFESDSLDEAYPNGFTAGGIDLLAVTVNGEPAEWAVQGEDETFLRVVCPLAAEERAQLGFEYVVLLPESTGRFGVGELDWRLANFFPSAAVYESGDWQLNPYIATGEPFYSEVADYHITLTAPTGWTVVSTGMETAAAPEEGTVTWTIEAAKVRDVAICLSRDFAQYQAQSSGVQVRVSGNDRGGCQAALSAAERAMEVFSGWFGDYPYEQFDVVASDFFLGGMEYPQLAVVGKHLFDRSRRDELTQVVVHELAHQWFYGLVGSNPSTEPWLDEAITSYVTLLYFEEVEGEESFRTRLSQQVTDSLKLTIPGGVTVDSEATRFNSLMEYDVVVYDRGAAVLHELRLAMGREAFLKALMLYVEEMRYANASIADFAGALERASGKNWDNFLMDQLFNIDDYANQLMDAYE